MTTNLNYRLGKLEAKRGNKNRRYVIRVSTPPTAAELAEIKAARYPFIIAPHKCESVEEWRVVHVAAAEKRRDVI